MKPSRFMDREGGENYGRRREGHVDFRDEMTRVEDGKGGMVWASNRKVQS